MVVVVVVIILCKLAHSYYTVTSDGFG